MPAYTFDVRPPTFARLLDGRLTFHVCVDNWQYAGGDTLCFRECHGQYGYTGRKLYKHVTCRYHGDGIAPGYVCLALGDRPPEDA